MTNGNEGDEERAYYDLNEKVYPAFAPFYDLVALPITRLRRQVVDLVGAVDGLKVLDVATGTGSQALAFAARGAEVVGIDISEAMLRVAQRKNHFATLAFRRADATKLPFSTAAFDVSVMSFAAHEMPESVRERALREMARVTRRDGKVVVVDYGLPRNPAGRWLVFHVVKLYERDHYAEFTHSDLPALLRRCGIEPIVDLLALSGIARIVVGSV
jgi:demethylmenaquinone methyltransferase/2-methoxy-6-polyprenyl-1,4-benzoquinol methylase